MGAVAKSKFPAENTIAISYLAIPAFTSVNESCRLEPLCRLRVNALNTKALDRQVRFSWVDYCLRRMHSVFEVALPMTTPRIPAPALPPSPPDDEVRPGLRAKTVATRLTPEELREVEAAAGRDGKSLAEWLRELALKTARQRPAGPMELLLSEVSATRYMLLNLFHATAQANAEGKHLLPDSVLKIRDQADVRKLESARKLMADFLAQGGQDGSQNGGKP